MRSQAKIIVVVLIVVGGVLFFMMKKSHPQPMTLSLTEPGGSQDGSSVTFTIAPEKDSPPGTVTYRSTYSKGGHAARFLLRLKEEKSSSSGPIPITFGNGSIISVAGSDAATLLPALKAALQAQHDAVDVKHLEKLDFTYATLGVNQSRLTQGGYDANSRGDWTTMKLFIGETSAQEPGEVYLNFNPKSGVAEFSIKDPDYGDIILRNLAAVL